MFAIRSLLFLSIGFWAVLATAADPLPAFNDPSAAGPDFRIQGEYQTELEIDGQPTMMAVQVIAQGAVKFHVVGYYGGFPGAGWDGERKVEVDADTIDGVATVVKDDFTSKITDGKITVLAPNGTQVAQFTRVDRASPTLGAKPPAGAIVLFDGSSPEQFKNGRMSDDGLLMQGATSLAKFGDCQIHLEFRLPFMPTARGQGRANSGCYVQSRYEVQILDSFGLAGKDNECGGLYKISAPKSNLCFPPLVWQTYDIDFTAAKYDGDAKKTSDARITVRHNGVVIQDDIALPGVTGGAQLKETPEPGPVYLQDHGNPVRFRNIWVLAR